MRRKRARGLILELCRRLYLKEHGTLKGFGKVAKHYRDDWRHRDYNLTGGYKKAWNCEQIKFIRKEVGML